MKNKPIEIEPKKQKCPYCHKNLEKIPSKKTKCKFCGNFIFVRTKPPGLEKILIKEDEVKKVEECWIKYALNSFWFSKLREMGAKNKDFVLMYDILKKRFNMTPSISDVMWGVFNNVLLKLIQKNNQEKVAELHELISEFKSVENRGNPEKLWKY